MKSCMLFSLPLVAVLILPSVAQQASADNQQATSSSARASSSSATSSSSSDLNANSDQNMSAHQPLQPELRQGFWGKLNPFARKKYVQNQLSPIRNRVNELDDLTAANAKAIKDVDARAQEGIRQASAKADQADQHATQAGNRAQQANQTALAASTRLNTVEQVVGNIDQYQTTAQTEIRYRSGQTVLGPKAKQALDGMTADLKDQKGYIVEVQGFSASRGQAGIQSSQAMANSVVRYLVEKNNIPVYRIYTTGMGNAKAPEFESGNASGAHGNRVEISVLKNNVDQLAMANQSTGMTGTPDATESGTYSGSVAAAPQQGVKSKNDAASQPANSNSSSTQH